MGLNQEQGDMIDQLYHDMYATLYAYAMSAMDDVYQAEEAVQDTFRIACVKVDELARSENQPGWLMNALKYVINNTHRSLARWNNMLVSLLSTCRTEEADWKQDLDFSVTYSELLGDEDFQLLQMVTIQKCTMLETATTYGITVEACKKRVQRAKKRAKQILEETM